MSKAGYRLISGFFYSPYGAKVPRRTLSTSKRIADLVTAHQLEQQLKSSEEYVVHWFRRDLRLNDNHALSLALRSGKKVIPLFIFDREILDNLEDTSDKRVQFIHDTLQSLDGALREQGSSILFLHGQVGDCFVDILRRFPISAVYCNKDYEPAARARDSQVEELLRHHGVAFHSLKDQVLFEENEVLKDDGTAYTVFTPYSRKWKAALADAKLQHFETSTHLNAFAPILHPKIPGMQQLGFMKCDYPHYPTQPSISLLKRYEETRNLPALDATTHLSVHLRFGTISIRECVRVARANSETWLNELIWREFFMMILYHHPRVVTDCFKPQYEAIAWRNDEQDFHSWCEGKTGYPMVDAGMRELKATGFMHNRVRMVVASFLCKHLLIDWRRGEAYFARLLLDYELSSNNGNWQWSAGCGCDAAPYFRVFNPMEQQRKFDPDLEYCKRWLDADDFYRSPIVDHAMARQRALTVYGAALKSMTA